MSNFAEVGGPELHRVLTRWKWSASDGPEPETFSAWEDVPERIRAGAIKTHRRYRFDGPVCLVSGGVSDGLDGDPDNRFYWINTTAARSAEMEAETASLLEIDGERVPDNYAAPDWDEEDRIHNWRNHVPPHVREIWRGFTGRQRQHLALWADDLARGEEWE